MSPTVFLYICSILCSHLLSVAAQESGHDPLDDLTFNDDSFGSIDYNRYRYTPNNVPSPGSDRLEIDFSVVPEGELGDVAHEECVIGGDENNNNNNYGSNADNNNEGGNDSGNDDGNNDGGNNDGGNNDGGNNDGGNNDGGNNDGGNNDNGGENGNTANESPLPLDRPITPGSKRSRRSKKSKRKSRRSKSQAPVAQPVPVQQFVATHADMDFHPINTPIYAKTANGILRGGEWERTIIPEDRLIDPVELSTMKLVSEAELYEWAGRDSSDEEGDGRLLVNQEKAAKRYKEDNYCVFECAYKDCKKRYTDIKSLHKHVVGYKRKAGDRYLSISCEARITEDGLNDKRIGSKQRPTRFPWGIVRCMVPEKVTSTTDEATGIETQHFDVPAAVQTQWDEWMVDERSEKEKAYAAMILGRSAASN